MDLFGKRWATPRPTQASSAKPRRIPARREIRPNSHVAHYNLAKVFLIGNKEHAAGSQIALSLDESPRYLRWVCE